MVGCFNEIAASEIQGRSQTKFQEEATSPPVPKNASPGVLPRIFFVFCIVVGEFWYIFGERKQTFLSSKTRVRGIVTGEFVNSALLYRRVLVNFGRTKTNFPAPIKRRSGPSGYCPRENFGILHCCRRVLVHFWRTKTNFPLP